LRNSGKQQQKRLNLSRPAVNWFSLKLFAVAASRSLNAALAVPISPYSPEFRPDSSRPAEKNSRAAAGLTAIRFTRESECRGLSKVQTGLRTRGRAYYQAFIKKL
jgi:hypothetical protein